MCENSPNQVTLNPTSKLLMYKDGEWHNLNRRSIQKSGLPDVS
jgi:hypothetical protein